MDKIRRKTKGIIGLVLLILGINAAFIYYNVFYSPKDSLELYRDISFADDYEKAQELMLDGHKGNFSEEDFTYINSIENSANSVTQYSLFEYSDRSYLIMTTPGTNKLEVLAVEQLPKEVRDYFLELTP